MSKLRLIREKISAKLFLDVPLHLAAYRVGSFDFLQQDQSIFLESEQQIDVIKLNKIDCQINDYDEVGNCEKIFEAMGQIPPYLARDPRVWIYLTHTTLLEYTRKRWPIPENDEKAILHIRTHFFATGSRGIERNNAASRLWWMASLCDRVEGLSLKEALTSFLHQTDVRANIIERPTTSQSIPVFSAVIKKLDASYKKDKELFIRDKFRAVMKDLNLKGGVRLLGVLSEDEISTIVEAATK